MTTEPLTYRLWKWVVQRVSRHRRSYEQHELMNSTDWDVLVVLDACRWDVLQSVTEWPIDACRSPGSTTGQWLETAEQTGVFEDVVVVSGQSQYAKYDVGARTVDPVWETEWDGRLGLVPPEPVYDVAADYIDGGDLPVVAHVLPPHAPYVARLGSLWVPIHPDVNIWKRNTSVRPADKISQQTAMATGHIDLRRAAQGYRASVESTWEVTLNYVEAWLERDLTVVVTADHGETFGRIRDFGLVEHPYDCHVAPLVRVPWVELKRGSPPSRTPESVDEKLEALGYVD
ncbi:hypothetical protein [Salinigranum salinum]|uniref:hypothetical protein n=1 Tax=Salinigranum salinum TaxID=1364937 RepID=UPI001260A0B0|nr:hypothetical protein [Salinigranum salinum]